MDGRNDQRAAGRLPKQTSYLFRRPRQRVGPKSKQPASIVKMSTNDAIGKIWGHPTRPWPNGIAPCPAPLIVHWDTVKRIACEIKIRIDRQ